MSKFASFTGPDGTLWIVPDAIVAVAPTNLRDPSSPSGTRTISLTGGQTLVVFDTPENLHATGIPKGNS